jgi:hypothetical protein
LWCCGPVFGPDVAEKVFLHLIWNLLHNGHVVAVTETTRQGTVMNVLPMLALSTLAAGYVAAIDRADTHFDRKPELALTSYAATPTLSVHDVMARASQSVDQPFCDNVDKVTETLAMDFAEVRQDAWVQGEDMAMQLWASDIMGTWTMIHVGQDNVACVVSSGTGWQQGLETAAIIELANIIGS